MLSLKGLVVVFCYVTSLAVDFATSVVVLYFVKKFCSCIFGKQFVFCIFVWAYGYSSVVVEFIKSLVPVIYVDGLDGVSYEGCFGYCKYFVNTSLVALFLLETSWFVVSKEEVFLL